MKWRKGCWRLITVGVFHFFGRTQTLTRLVPSTDTLLGIEVGNDIFLVAFENGLVQVYPRRGEMPPRMRHELWSPLKHRAHKRKLVYVTLSPLESLVLFVYSDLSVETVPAKTVFLASELSGLAARSLLAPGSSFRSGYWECTRWKFSLGNDGLFLKAGGSGCSLRDFLERLLSIVKDRVDDFELDAFYETILRLQSRRIGDSGAVLASQALTLRALQALNLIFETFLLHLSNSPGLERSGSLVEDILALDASLCNSSNNASGGTSSSNGIASGSAAAGSLTKLAKQIVNYRNTNPQTPLFPKDSIATLVPFAQSLCMIFLLCLRNACAYHSLLEAKPTAPMSSVPLVPLLAARQSKARMTVLLALCHQLHVQFSQEKDEIVGSKAEKVAEKSAGEKAGAERKTGENAASAGQWERQLVLIAFEKPTFNYSSGATLLCEWNFEGSIGSGIDERTSASLLYLPWQYTGGSGRESWESLVSRLGILSHGLYSFARPFPDEWWFGYSAIPLLPPFCEPLFLAERLDPLIYSTDEGQQHRIPRLGWLKNRRSKGRESQAASEPHLHFDWFTRLPAPKSTQKVCPTCHRSHSRRICICGTPA